MKIILRVIDPFIGEKMHEQLHLTTTWVGILSFIVFVIGYYFIATEDKYHVNKAKI